MDTGSDGSVYDSAMSDGAMPDGAMSDSAMPDGNIPDGNTPDGAIPLVLKAFPSAEGAGANTTGGRGGVIVHVTNLDDNGEGSLRWAITQPDLTTPRTIVFDVSGTIVMNRWLDIGRVRNLTIAGQTAPEGGITVQTPAFYLDRSDNIIIRYVRFVNTSYFHSQISTHDNASAFGSSGTNNLILDHCSMRYAWNTVCAGFQDANETTDGQGNVTLQRSILGDCATGALFGAIVADPRNELAGSNSIHHNLFAHISHRFPNIAGNAQAEVVENVAYNYRARLNTFFNDSESNFVNNTFRAGPTSLFGHRRNKIGDYVDTANGFDTPRVFMSGNRIDEPGDEFDHLPSATDMAGLFVIWLDTSGGDETEVDAASEARFRALAPFAPLGIPITELGTDAAYEDVLSDVGANAYLNADGTTGRYLDIMDNHYIDDTRNGTLWSGGTGHVNKTDASALIYPELPTNTRPADYDTDLDGIPNAVEDATEGLDSSDGADGALLHESGYSNLEFFFLNNVD